MKRRLAPVVHRLGIVGALASPESLSLIDDLVDIPTIDVLSDTTSAARNIEPRVFYLFYPDGKTPSGSMICPGMPPAYTCSFGGTEGVLGCQKRVQTFLDKWYADFNVIFTLKRPTSGPFYTEVITNGGSWCGHGPAVGGIAPFACVDQNGNTCHAFQCGSSARTCAIVIAQEQAHLVGLEHTASQADVMNPTVCMSCDGFQNAESPVVDSRCRMTRQNSYQMMLSRLGPWPAGTAKPSPFEPVCPPGGKPVVTITQPADGATVPDAFSVHANATDPCEIKKMHIKVSPIGLEADGVGVPVQWDLVGISDRQTIEVTATNGAGATASASITVVAQGAGLPDAAEIDDSRVRGENYGCRVSAGRPSSVDGGTGFALAALAALVTRCRSRSRR